MIDLSGLQQWLDDPNGPIARDMRRRADRVAARAKQLAPVASGRLRSTIHVDGPTRGANGLAYDVVADVDYAAAVHDGRRPGARMPPSAAIERWAGTRGAAGAGFVIARAIGERGIPARPFLADALPAAVR